MNMFLPQPFPPFSPEDRGGQRQPEAQTPWGKLARGAPLGKGTNLSFTGATSVGAAQSSPVDILNVQGADGDAQQMCVTLAPPEAYPFAAAAADIQTMSGSVDNISLVRTFPGGVAGKVIGTVPQLSFPNAVALVEWGIGGISNRVEADFSNGLCLNLTASFLRIKAFMQGAEGDGSMGTTGIYRLSGNVGPGFPKANNAQRTIPISELVLVNTESAVYTVPRYAKTVFLTGANVAKDLFSGFIRFYSCPDIVFITTPVSELFFSGNSAGPLPVPNGAKYFTFTPSIALASMSAVFDLAI